MKVVASWEDRVHDVITAAVVIEEVGKEEVGVGTRLLTVLPTRNSRAMNAILDSVVLCRLEMGFLCPFCVCASVIYTYLVEQGYVSTQGRRKDDPFCLRFDIHLMAPFLQGIRVVFGPNKHLLGLTNLKRHISMFNVPLT